MKPLTLSFQLEGFLPYPTAGIVVYLPLGSNFQMFLTAVFSFAFMSFTSPFCLMVPWAGHGFFSVVKLCWIKNFEGFSAFKLVSIFWLCRYSSLLCCWTFYLYRLNLRSTEHGKFQRKFALDILSDKNGLVLLKIVRVLSLLRMPKYVCTIFLLYHLWPNSKRSSPVST